MSVNAVQFRTLLVRPTLQMLDIVRPGMYSEAAENLLVGTAAQESHLCTYIKQVGGPAMGPFQIEEPTFHDIVNRYLDRKQNHDLWDVVEDLSYAGLPLSEASQLITNLPLGCAIARIKYWMSPAPLPESYDLHGMAYYWKRFYNTAAGAGTVDEFVENYEHYAN